MNAQELYQHYLRILGPDSPVGDGGRNWIAPNGDQFSVEVMASYLAIATEAALPAKVEEEKP